MHRSRRWTFPIFPDNKKLSSVVIQAMAEAEFCSMSMRIRLFLVLILSVFCMTAYSQVFHEGEKLRYRVAYKAKMVPNTEVGEVTMDTTVEQVDGRDMYHVKGVGYTLKFFKCFFKMRDEYNIWADCKSLRTHKFQSDIKEGKYTYSSHYDYDWPAYKVRTWAQSRNRDPQEKEIPLTDDSMDAVSLYYNLRSIDTAKLVPQQTRNLKMVLADTVKVLQYKFINREIIKVPHLGRFKTMKFTCTLGTTEEFSFTDGAEFTIWISDDGNLFPVMLASPVKVGRVRAYIRSYDGMKYPVDSFLGK